MKKYIVLGVFISVFSLTIFTSVRAQTSDPSTIQILSSTLPDAFLGQPYFGSIKFHSTLQVPISVTVSPTTDARFSATPEMLPIGLTIDSLKYSSVVLPVATDGTAQLNIIGTPDPIANINTMIMKDGAPYTFNIYVSSSAPGPSGKNQDFALNLKPTCFISQFSGGITNWSSPIRLGYVLGYQNLCQSLTISGGSFNNTSLSIPAGSAGLTPETVIYSPTTFTLTATGKNGTVSTKTATVNIYTPPSASVSCNISVNSTGNGAGYKYTLTGIQTVNGSGVTNIVGTGNSSYSSQPAGNYTIAYIGGASGALTSITPSTTQNCLPGSLITYTLNFNGTAGSTGGTIVNCPAGYTCTSTTGGTTTGTGSTASGSITTPTTNPPTNNAQASQTLFQQIVTLQAQLQALQQTQSVTGATTVSSAQNALFQSLLNSFQTYLNTSVAN